MDIKATIMAVKVGEIVTDNLKDLNAWRVRMLKAGLGELLILPDDWDSLSEEVKDERLRKAIKALE